MRSIVTTQELTSTVKKVDFKDLYIINFFFFAFCFLVLMFTKNLVKRFSVF